MRVGPNIILAAVCGCFNLGDSAAAQEWVLTGAPVYPWSSVACSADGSKVVAAATNGFIYTSTNSGATWTSNSIPNESWTGVASSANGTKLIAAASAGPLFISTNSGANWISNTPSKWWRAVASSADGTKLLAASIDAIYISTDSGATWISNRIFIAVPVGESWRWTSVASSADGSRLLAAEQSFYLMNPEGGQIYVSTTSGATWTSISPNAAWTSVASSADGSKLMAACTNGPIYLSTNSGTAWTSNNVPGFPPPQDLGPVWTWPAVASSANGTRLVAACRWWFIGPGGVMEEPGTGLIYTSTNSGETWTTNNVPNANWTSVASSADGTKLLAASPQGIYIFQPIPVLGLAISNHNLILSWPSSASGFELQQNCDLATTNWTAVTNFPAATDGRYQVNVSTTGATCFYRLKYP